MLVLSSFLCEICFNQFFEEWQVLTHFPYSFKDVMNKAEIDLTAASRLVQFFRHELVGSLQQNRSILPVFRKAHFITFLHGRVLAEWGHLYLHLS